jgi:hypothetical protein
MSRELIERFDPTRRIRIADVLRSGIDESLLDAAGVKIAKTSQRLGGYRRWLVCPGCRRRCAELFLPAVGALQCRRCLGLAYLSQREIPEDRLYRRAFAIYDQINVDYSQHPRVRGPKPAGMRQREYWSLYERANDLDNRATLTMGARFRRPRRS